MATIRKRGASWHVQIRRNGFRALSKSFKQRSHALAWARKIESEMDRGTFADFAIARQTKVIELLSRYQKEILPHKRARASEISRLKWIGSFFGEHSLAQLTPALVTRYRSERLRNASAQTVVHELSLLRRILNVGIDEWEIALPRGNPITGKLLPRLPSGRTRRFDTNEEKRLLHALNGNKNMEAVIQFALETAMRRREIAQLTWDCVDIASKSVLIRDTKTDTPREIPLSNKAIQALKNARGFSASSVFGMQPDSITQAFIRACKRANISNLRFHDLRHEATSVLSRKYMSKVFRLYRG